MAFLPSARAERTRAGGGTGTSAKRVIVDRSGQPITADARLAGQRVTGTFEASRPVAEVLDALAVPLGARVERTDGGGFVLR